MSFSNLLIDRCNVLRKVVDTSGMNDTESFETVATNVPCRILKKAASLFNPDKAQHGVVIRIKITFLSTQSLTAGGMIVHEGRGYQIVEVTPASTTQLHHQVAICEVVAGFRVS